MKNLNYFPYERNNYFYGKLLSVDDFESEQKYMNDKRRLINRFMHGCGVVCGLNVVPVGDDTISLEAGLALDFAGREIVVDKPVLKKLTGIEGFLDDTEENESGSYQYLCIEYSEYEREPVYGVTGLGSVNGEACYNKTAEGYRIYLTSQEPQENSGSDSYYEKSKTIYWGYGIRITQVFPRYVHSGSEFEFRLVVENMGQKLPISFGYELVFDCLSRDKKRWMKLVFDEKEWERARRYEVPVVVRAADVSEVSGVAALKEGSFWLKVGDYIMETEELSVQSTVEIVTENVSKIISKRYFEGAMQEIINQTYHQSIYLAKINLIQAANEVVIEDVEPMPFGQYIYSDVLSTIRERAAEEEQKMIKRRLSDLRDGKSEDEQEKKEEPSLGTFVSGGTVTIELGIGGAAGKKFYSKPIVHGLGPGNVTVMAGIEHEEDSVFYGAGGIFEREGLVRGETAVRINVSEGTFVVGVRLAEATKAEKINIRWTAFCDGSKKRDAHQERELFIKPDMVYLSLHEDFYFEAVVSGVSDKRILWSLREAVGGDIDENGMYTAPNTPGVYEIVARSAADNKLTASAFAVVRDIHKTE